jgi:hypothetical protein
MGAAWARHATCESALRAFVCRFILSRMHINQIVTHDSQNRSVLEEESLECLTLTFKALRFWKESLGLINPTDLHIKNIRKKIFFPYADLKLKERFFESSAPLYQSTRIHISDNVILQQYRCENLKSRTICFLLKSEYFCHKD